MGIYKVIKIKRPKKWNFNKIYSLAFIRNLKRGIKGIGRIKIRSHKKRFSVKNASINMKFVKKVISIGIVFIIIICMLNCFYKICFQKTQTIGDTTEDFKNINGIMWFLKETIPFFGDTANFDIKEKTAQELKTAQENSDNKLKGAEELNSIEDLKKYVFTIDASAYVNDDELDLNRLQNTDITAQLQSKEPKVLIFHTHSQEDFIDSQAGNVEDTIVGVGQVLAEILSNQYNITVVHDVGTYDVEDGKEKRNGSYEVMEPAITKLLKKYPSIEVCIDLHRDGVGEGVHLVTDINGKPTAKIMYFNGICRLNDNGEPKDIEGLENKYIKQNLALSFQMQMKTNELYPNFARKIYIKPYRYSLHMKPLSLLIEAGANTNTVEEVKNAMEPLAEILVEVVNQKKS